MSKQEIYVWSSLAMDLGLPGLYLLMFWGLPEGMERQAEALSSLFLKVIGIAVLIEVVLELSRRAGSVEKDERDERIAAKGYRNAYWVFMSASAALLVHVFVSDVLSQAAGEPVFLARPFLVFHLLLLILFAASLTRYGTQVYFYRRGI
ncbi:MAG: hypothetical protein KatS3mg043_2139 [Rhodothermaceae bacterium]|nr:MAG: hypothetical protein KatS3mg043_2139 [Rhodothermaceae bacterium]